MPKYRKDRINRSVAEEIAAILREVKNPVVAGTMISVTAADVSQDLKFAKIYYSVLGDADEKELKMAFRSAAPFIRSQLAHRLNLRITPELSFVRDNGIAHGAEIASILHGLHQQAEEAAESTEAAEPGHADAETEENE